MDALGVLKRARRFLGVQKQWVKHLYVKIDDNTGKLCEACINGIVGIPEAIHGSQGWGYHEGDLRYKELMKDLEEEGSDRARRLIVQAIIDREGQQTRTSHLQVMEDLCTIDNWNVSAYWTDVIRLLDDVIAQEEARKAEEKKIREEEPLLVQV